MKNEEKRRVSDISANGQLVSFINTVYMMNSFILMGRSGVRKNIRIQLHMGMISPKDLT